MTIKTLTWLTFSLLLEVSTIAYAGSIKKVWDIPVGNGKDQIVLGHPMDDWFDFEVYRGKLFLSDLEQDRIKAFDHRGKCIGEINLPGVPEIMKIWHGVLVVLVQNGQLGVYDLATQELRMINLGIEVKPYSYSNAFFSDSLLFIPDEHEFVSIRSAAYVINISKLPHLEVVIKKNAYDIEKEINWPDSMHLNRKDYFIQQSDLCFDSRRVSIIDRYNKNAVLPREEYFLLDKQNNRFFNLGSVPDSFGLVLHPNECRGFKVYKDGIYFISERMKSGKAESIIIGKMAFPVAW